MCVCVCVVNPQRELEEGKGEDTKAEEKKEEEMVRDEAPKVCACTEGRRG